MGRRLLQFMCIIAMIALRTDCGKTSCVEWLCQGKSAGPSDGPALFNGVLDRFFGFKCFFGRFRYNCGGLVCINARWCFWRDFFFFDVNFFFDVIFFLV